MAADLRADPPRLYAAVNHPVWGPSVAKSTDLGKTWEQRSQGLGFPQDMQLAVTNVWFVQPGHETEPGVVCGDGARRPLPQRGLGPFVGAHRGHQPARLSPILAAHPGGGRLPPARSG